MMQRSPGFTDLATGLLLIAVAAVGYWLVADLRLGTPQRMGPGYLPRLMCAILALLGGSLLVRAFVVGGEGPEPWAWRPLALVSIAIALFALGIERYGLVASVVALVVVGSLPAPGMRPGEVVALAVGLAAFAAFVFVKLLGLTMPLWPG